MAAIRRRTLTAEKQEVKWIDGMEVGRFSFLPALRDGLLGQIQDLLLLLLLLLSSFFRDIFIKSSITLVLSNRFDTNNFWNNPLSHAHSYDSATVIMTQFKSSLIT